VDHHLRGANRLAGREGLQQPLGDDSADQRVLTVDREAPERAMNSEPSAIAIELALDVVGDRSPVTVERRRVHEILDLEIALLLDDPAAIGGEASDVHGSTDKRRRRVLCHRPLDRVCWSEGASSVL